MKTKGSIFLVVALAVVVLAMVGYALMMAQPSGGSGAASGGTPGATFTVSVLRTPTGITATVTAVNKGSADLRNLTITRATLGSMTVGTALPRVVGALPRGATSTLTIPYSGPAPSAKSPMKLELQYDYKFGFFGNGSGSQDITTILP